MNRSRLIALSAAALLAGVAPIASAAPTKPQIVDTKGDAIGLQGMHDIVSTTFAITKTVKKVGKKTVTTPNALVITMKLAGAPSIAPGTHYGIVAATDCGALGLNASIGAFSAPDYSASGSFFECGPEQEVAGVTVAPFSVTPVLTLGPDTVTFTVPYKGLPKEITVGDKFFDLVAYTAPAEPVFGFDTQTFTSLLGVESTLDIARGERATLS